MLLPGSRFCQSNWIVTCVAPLTYSDRSLTRAALSTGESACPTTEACHKARNYEQSQILIGLNRQNLGLSSPALEEHRQECLCYKPKITSKAKFSSG
jgi:hypothetical protein